MNNFGHSIEEIQIRRPPLIWQLLRLLIAGSKDQAFLNRAWIAWLLGAVSPRFLRKLSLELLALSPHYFTYQFSNKYAKGLPRTEILRQEYERNRASRKEICDKLLKPYLHSNIRVLDFGCGPGFMAKEVSKYGVNVLGTDVSRGVIACAQVLNAGPGVSFMNNCGKDLRNIDDNSIDLVYSFAVFQHLENEQTLTVLKEFKRILKCGGMGVCHFAVNESGGSAQPQYPAWIRWYVRRIKLRMNYLSSDELKQLLIKAGFKEITITPIETMAEIDDAIGQQHLVTFKPDVGTSG